MGWFHCNSVRYVGLKQIWVILINLFLENQCFSVHIVLGQVNVIAYNMLFLKN